MNENYTLNKLLETFKSHADDYDNFLKENPQLQEIETFNLPRAMECLALEIKELKQDFSVES